MAEKLLRPTWANLDQHEFRLLLKERLGGLGQYDGKETNPIKIYLPLARDQCKVVLTFKDKKIVAVEPGQAFDSAQWQKICGEIENTILVGPQKVGREYSFCSFRVTSSWRGQRSGVQILPPPPKAPSATDTTEHPFILEFPIKGAPDDLFWSITNHRRIREHRRWTRVLNVLLRPRLGLLLSSRSQHFWAHIPPNGEGDGQTRWLQKQFFAPLGPIVTDALSPAAAEGFEEIDVDTYYGVDYDYSMSMRVPRDLDNSLCCYRYLTRENRAKFDRSAYWLDMAARQWTMSVSASFASLVSAVESLTERGTKHQVYCAQCEKQQTHESPGATERFHSFFETYAPGAALKKRRNLMYDLRSNILHGGDLMLIDQDLDFGWDPPGLTEDELYKELWGITKLAVRNWLKSTSIVPGMSLPDKVSTLNADHSLIEVYSVPFGDDPYLYARRLNEQNKDHRTRSIGAFLIESQGERRTISGSEIAS
jgi:hypothetical protein